MGESVCVTVGMKDGTGLRFNRGGRSALGLFIAGAAVGIKDIRNDASIALYVEVSESTDVVLEWETESNKRSLSSVVTRETDDCTMGDLDLGDTSIFTD